METLISQHWNHLAVEEVALLQNTDTTRGLSPFEVRHRQERFGPNVVSGRKGKGPLIRFLLQFHQPLIYILLAAGIITALLGEGVDSGVIFGVVVVNAIVGFVQESKAEKALESLKQMVTTDANVIRDGQRVRIPSAELIPGDIVVLTSGDKVPADMRLFLIRDLKVDESALTGESVAVEKSEELLSKDTILADRTNMAYAGSLVTYGQGQGIVVATGNNTETGRISELVAGAATIETPLTKKIARFSRLLLYVILALAVITFVVGLLRGESAHEMFMAAVALAVGAIPEGLPAAVTITLAIGVGRMARRKAIIRKLPAVETLGSTTVICSDKTGTLTENQMTVQKIFAGSALHSVTGSGYAPEGQITDADPEDRALRECLIAGMLCNDAQLVRSGDRWTIQGDPTEGALIVAGRKGGLDEKELASRRPTVDVLPFESHHQYMATLHDSEADQPRIVYLKGATEKVLERCTDRMGPGGESQNLDPDEIRRISEDLARTGLRVLALARKTVERERTKIDHSFVSSGLTFLGLQAMIDPPRVEAIRAVAACKSAGIRVKMITGDHALTASAIGKQLNLDVGENGPPTLTGRELAELSDRELIEAADRTVVFARVAPEQKLRLVEAIQAKQHIVAMTGDGVNDAPALKQANIGIAMGITGTEVSKEAADMILVDDNFATIESAVEEGRGIFDNLTKFITWTLPTNMGEGLVILASIAIGTALPIQPVQILWINMTTAILLGLTLAFEPSEPGIMSRPPRLPESPILNLALIRRILVVSVVMLAAAFGLFLLHKKGKGADVAVARTVAVNVFVIIETFYLYRCRSLTRPLSEIGYFSNPWVLAGTAAMILLQILFTYLPVMNRLFQSAPIGIVAWLEILAAGVIAYYLVMLEQQGFRRPKTQT